MHHFLVCMYILQGKSLAMIFVYQKINALKIFFFLRFGHIALYATCACTFGHIQLFATPWTVACQAPLSMGFSRQEYWSECHFLLQGIFLTQGLNSCLLHLLHWRPILYQLSHWGSPCAMWRFYHFASSEDMFEDAWFPTTLPSEFVVKFWNVPVW